jgi:hypothetical protein
MWPVSCTNTVIGRANRTDIYRSNAVPKPCVAGSNPAGGTNLRICLRSSDPWRVATFLINARDPTGSKSLVCHVFPAQSRRPLAGVVASRAGGDTRITSKAGSLLHQPVGGMFTRVRWCVTGGYSRSTGSTTLNARAQSRPPATAVSWRGCMNLTGSVRSANLGRDERGEPSCRRIEVGEAPAASGQLM